LNPPVYLVLTTYNRKDCAVKTIEAIKRNLIYDNYGWYLVDDGSSPSYIEELKALIGSDRYIYTYDSQRRGVGHGMNHALRDLWDQGINYTLHLEDDWELINPLQLEPYIRTIEQVPTVGMIRFGYLSTGILATTIGEAETGIKDILYWRLEENQETYRFTGHPSLRHRRFHDKYQSGSGLYDEGLTPGMTELSMCGKVNKYTHYQILYPCACGQWGFFAHIGTEHLGGVEPEVKP
jgi:glycosyltransferase involved in cell wall biosynthesis